MHGCVARGMARARYVARGRPNTQPVDDDRRACVSEPTDMDVHRALVKRPDRDLHVCIDCSSELVYPVVWEEAGPDGWRMLLHCPGCDVRREGIFGNEAAEAFDEELDRGMATLTREYKRVMRENMAAEIERLVCALDADALLPEDF